MKRILIPLDGSATAETVLPAVRRMVIDEEPELILLRVISEMATDASPAQYATEASHYLANVREWLGAKHVRAIVDFGDAAKTILSVADREDPALIVMTTGKVAKSVVRGTRVPVLLVQAQGVEIRPIRTILLPIGGGEASLEIVPVVKSIAEEQGASVVLLRISESEVDSISFVLRAEDELRRAKIPVSTLFEKGDPAVVILDTARMYGADLIAMATHARAGLSRLVLGSVTEQVLREARIPLLVVRSAGRPHDSGVDAVDLERRL